jgi:hypothetical protein
VRNGRGKVERRGRGLVGIRKYVRDVNVLQSNKEIYIY